MRVRLFAAMALAGATIVSGACSQDRAQSTDDTTRSLLSQPIGDGMSTILGTEGSIDAGGPQVPVSEVGFNRGAIEAPVKVLEMSDYGCGYCRKFHQETFPTLLTQFIESGMVEWKFVPYITGMFENSLVATEAAECTYAQDEDAFERLNDHLWTDQQDWKRSSDPESVVRGWVSELGIDLQAFDDCLASDDRMDRIAASTRLAKQVGVRGTPTFIVIGYPPLQGALPLEMFQQVLEAVHAEATAEGGQ